MYYPPNTIEATGPLKEQKVILGTKALTMTMADSWIGLTNEATYIIHA